MKTTKKTIFLLIVTACILSNVISKTHKTHKAHKTHKGKHTPKGVNLMNHYGAQNVGSPYGPQFSYENEVVSNPEVYTPHRFDGVNRVKHQLDFKPYPGYESRLNPHLVKSGDFTNIAPTAKDVISPEITGPKLRIQGQVNYPSQVRSPKFYGYRKELHPVRAYDRYENKIIEDKAILTKPWYGYEDKVMNVNRKVDRLVDLKNGKIASTDQPLKNHGIDTLKAPSKEDHKEKKHRLRR